MPTDAWEGTSALIAAWWGHDGWRTSGASWFWGGIAVGATTGAVLLRSGQRSPGPSVWRWAVFPATAIAALGPLVQVLSGFRWSNYADGHDSRSTIVVYAIGLVVAVGLPFLHEWAVRGRGRIDGDGDGALRR